MAWNEAQGSQCAHGVFQMVKKTGRSVPLGSRCWHLARLAVIRSPIMAIDHVVSLLIAERDKLMSHDVSRRKPQPEYHPDRYS